MIYSSALLPQTNDPQEIQKSILDLLQKINQMSSTLDAAIKTFEPISQRTMLGAVGWFNAVPINNGSSLTFPAFGTWEWAVVEPHDGLYNSKTADITTGISIPGTASQDIIIYYKRLS